MYQGIITPMVIPFNRDEKQSINYEATKALIEHLIKHKVHGIFVLGTNGEFHVVSDEEKVAFTEYVVKEVNHRIPVFTGVGACSTTQAKEMAQKAEKTGVDAISLLPPFYVKPMDDEIIGYVKAVAESISIPVILYNIPKNTGYSLSPEVFDACLEIENVIGIKDSSGNTELLDAYLEISKKHGKYVWVGSDSKISYAYAHGARGAIAGTSNLITDVIVGLHEALMNQDEAKAQQLQKDVDVLRGLLPLGAVPSVLKRSMELAGVAQVGPARLPVKDIKGLYDEKIQEMLAYYGMGEKR